MWKGADDDRDTHRRPRHNRTDSIPSSAARLPHLTSPDAAAAASRTPSQSPAISSTHRFPASISRNTSFKGNAMPAVHYYLGRPARVWISAHSRRSPARQARTGSGDGRSGIPGQPARGFTPPVPAAAHGSADACSRRASNQKSPVTAASGLPPTPPPPAACWPAAESQSPASAPTWLPPAASAQPWPPDWTRPTTRSYPEAYPRPWERAQVYLGLCERYQELYQTQVAELHLLMAAMPGSSLPLPHHRPLTDP